MGFHSVTFNKDFHYLIWDSTQSLLIRPVFSVIYSKIYVSEELWIMFYENYAQRQLYNFARNICSPHDQHENNGKKLNGNSYWRKLSGR